MAGFDSGEVVVAGTGRVYVAPVGTPFPASIAEPIDPDDWEDVGYCTPEGATFNFGREINRVMAWQSFDPVRMVVTAVPKTVGFQLLQWNQATLKLALGGGTVNAYEGGEYEYEPADESFVDERALIVTGEDGDRSYRFCFRKAINEAGVEFDFVRENPSQLPISMVVLAADGGLKPYVIQTDDPAIGEPPDIATS